MVTLKKAAVTRALVPAIAGFGLVSGTVTVTSAGAAGPSVQAPAAPLPAAKPRSGVLPAACNPCNPCAAANPCSPCNPCKPRAAQATGSETDCVVPRLQQAWATSPCNPCNPCEAGNPCNPCAAANPCRAANPCNPCNPCAAGGSAEITAEEAAEVYGCLKPEMAAAYAKADVDAVAGYTDWVNVAAAPYPSATHGGRHVNNYANPAAAGPYQRYEDVGTMPAGSVLAKDSFSIGQDGSASIGPLFVMEKLEAGTSEQTHDWRYTLILAQGSVFGVTGGKNSAGVQYCVECHAAVAGTQDSLFFLPEDMRVAR